MAGAVVGEVAEALVNTHLFVLQTIVVVAALMMSIAALSISLVALAR